MDKMTIKCKNTQDGTVESSVTVGDSQVHEFRVQGTAGAYVLASLIYFFEDKINTDAYLFTPIFVMYDGKELQVTSFEVTADIDDNGDATNLKVVLS